MSVTAERLRADAAGRRAAQTRFDGTVVLEAGAGTGKTTTLVARILAWALDRGWAAAAARSEEQSSPDRIAAEVLHGIVAITFTEAGAAEMATRVASALAQLTSTGEGGLPGFEPELLSIDGPEEIRSRALHLLGALDHLTVETIHAFCRGLLSSYPLEAGLHPELRVDSDLRLTEEIVHEVVDGAVRLAYARPRGKALAELATQGIGPDRLVATLVGLREEGFEARALATDPFSATRIRGLVERLASRIDGFLAAGAHDLRNVTSGNKAAAIATAVERTLERLTTPPTDLAELAGMRRDLERLWHDHANKMRDWSRGRYTKGEAAVLERHGDAFPAAAAALRSLLRHLERMEPERLDAARRALAPLLAECERRSTARGIVTFSDLLARAERLLSERTGLRRREQRRIQQLLVDEFQDTDPLQCEIVRLLALDGPEADRPGLFLVGDPKQSIFGWRDADLAAYEQFVEAALAAGGERFDLVRNFRSDPPILDEVTAVIEPVMVSTPGLQPPFVGLEADRHGSRLQAPDRRPVEYWVSWTGGGGPKTRGDESALLEAGAIARDIRALHDEGGVRWSEIALLFRSTSRLDAYLEALRDRDVPFLVTRDKHYYRRKEVIEAAALVRTVVDPLDHLALVAFLRSASVGVPDAALVPLWKHDFPRLMSAVTEPSSTELAEALVLVDAIEEEIPDDVPGIDRISGWPHTLAAALEDIAVLRQSFRDDSATEFIGLLRTRTLIEVTEAARYQGKFRLANLDRFFRRLEQAMIERGNDMLAILRTLRRSLDEAPDAQEAPPKDSGEDAVQVLTIHKAKGLEFDHVYLPQLHARTRYSSEIGEVEVDRRWRGSEAPQYCLLGSATPSWNEVLDRSRRVEATESVRLLYVALTRARQRVVLLGRWPATLSPKAAEEALCQLDLVASRTGLARGPAELTESSDSEDRAWIDDSGLRWHFLGLAADDDPRRHSRPDPEWLPTVAAIATEKAALEERRTRAVARMARPRHVAASNEVATRLAQLAGRQEPPGDGPRPAPSRDLAMLVGTVVHSAFEEWDLTAGAGEELERARLRAATRLRDWLPGVEGEEATARAESLFDRFSGGTLWQRWLAIADHVVARELPMLAPASPGDEAVDHLTGVIDLLYRDPGDGDWVVADFKTDRVEGEDALTARAEVYGAQEAVYVEAVRQALGLSTAPRAELWFLWPDRLWRSS